MREKIKLEELAEVVFYAMKDENTDCELHTLHEDCSNPIYEITFDSEYRIVFLYKQVWIEYKPKHIYRTRKLREVISDLEKDSKGAFSEYRYITLEKGDGFWFVMEPKGGRRIEGSTRAELTVSYSIKYNLNSCDINELIPEILYQTVALKGDMNEFDRRVTDCILE